MIGANAIKKGFFFFNALPSTMENRAYLSNQYIDNIEIGGGSVHILCTNNKYYDSNLDDYGLSNWKAHLAEHPLVVMTYLDEPIERDLTPSEIQAYQNLVTYAGTTIVENDAECYMEVSAGGGDTLRAKKLALLLGD